jgi:hypothetical protein
VTVTGNAQANITSVGTLTDLSVSGNITGGNLLTGGILSATGNLQTGASVVVPNGGRYRGDFTSGATAGRSLFQTTGTGTNAPTVLTAIPGASHTNFGSWGAATGLFSHSDTGNSSVFGMYALGNESRIWSTNFGTGNVNNMTFRFGSAANIGATLDTTGNFTAVGNIIGANVTTAGVVSAAGNITGNYFIGNGSALTGIAQTSPGGSNTQIQFNDGGVFAGNSAVTFNKTTGNIGLGNMVINALNLNTANTLTFTSSTVNNPARILVGNAVGGNSSVAMDAFNRQRNTRLAVWDYVARGDGNIPATEATFEQDIELTGNIASNSTTRITATQSILHIGGGASAFQSLHASPFVITGHQGGVYAGTYGNIAVGNTIIGGASGFQAIIAANTGGTITNAVGMLSQPQIQGGQLTNVCSFAANPVQITAPPAAPTNYYAFYNPGLTNTVGPVTQAGFRAATNYYAFRNDDAVAQVQLGTLRSYNEFNYVNPTTSGALTIDKVNAQVQQINLTGNITSITYANLVSSLSDGVNTDEEADTVTLIFNQGATGGYSVAFPTGSTYKYAGNLTAIGTTANSVSMVSVTAIRLSGTTTYLTTISPEFV